MALVSMEGGLWYPRPLTNTTTGIPTFANLIMDATGEMAAPFIGRASKSGTLDSFGFRLGAVTQAPANGLRCSFQDLSSGNPDGVADQFRVVTAGLTANTWVEPGLLTSDGTDGGVKRVVTKGDWISCVVAFENFIAGDSLQVNQFSAGASSPGLATYAALFTSSWAKQTEMPVIGLKYNDGTYGSFFGTTVPASLITVDAFNSTSSPNQRGSIISFPWDCEIGGLWVRVDLDNDADLVFYDVDGTTPLATVSMLSANRSGTNGRDAWVPCPSFSVLANTNYRVALKPTTTSNASTYSITVPSAAHMNSLSGGQNTHQTTRVGTDAWIETTTIRSLIGVIITAIDIPAGGGGGAIGNSMRGGFVN